MRQHCEDCRLGHLLALTEYHPVVPETAPEPMLDRADSRGTRPGDFVVEDPVQFAGDLFPNVLLGFRRLGETGAVR